MVSDDPGQLVFSTICDSNCCVDLGRLTVLAFQVSGQTLNAAHYFRFPWAQPIAKAECDQVEQPFKLMCVNLATRKSCAGMVAVGSAVDAGM